ncbi:Aldedh-domain-containing protein [Aspergillus ellipticus CBS 707.79]|uniref:aldehyde dehydrogenase (NAD(+)) n=1 Tax=Aspergillus ellipticus CBS 707.79 TaxID=1448320 RepID=A0A319CRA5_9EURO|nr:Aldedh-domain-containing protein [Aspergillus ellipticus CBS 707.79]
MGEPTTHPGQPAVIETRLFINNEFVPSRSGNKFHICNPATEALGASVYEADAEDVELAVAAAQAAFPAWSELGGLQRAAARSISKQMGRPARREPRRDLLPGCHHHGQACVY